MENTSVESPQAAAPGWELRLYVVGQTLRSLAATLNLRKICEDHLAGCHKMVIIDLVQHPDRARDDDILAIPTLVRVCPLPIKKLVGDLSNNEVALKALGLSS